MIIHTLPTCTTNPYLSNIQERSETVSLAGTDAPFPCHHWIHECVRLNSQHILDSIVNPLLKPLVLPRELRRSGLLRCERMGDRKLLDDIITLLRPNKRRLGVSICNIQGTQSLQRLGQPQGRECQADKNQE
ncbi:hypothetical protein VNO77_31005 [Canavalia gladiata]|uniref:Uncharacterized protein n=1 Tax=Canavalia gladiata TaxID=3824 RepID=A0AAN9Q3U1_CANGL